MLMGFTHFELLVVVAIAVVAAAIAVPVVYRAKRHAALETARSTVASALREGSERAAYSGATAPFDVTKLALAPDVVLMPPGLTSPEGTVACTNVAFEGGTGYPLADGERAAIVILLAERGRETETAIGVGLGRGATVTTYRLSNGSWEVAP